MPPRVFFFSPRVSRSLVEPVTLPFRSIRYYADKPAPTRPSPATARLGKEAPEASTEQLPHVSEEAATMSRITGTEGPDVEEHGTPVAEVAKGDEIEKHMPQIVKEEMKKDTPSFSAGKTGSRHFSTLVRPGRQFSTSSQLRLLEIDDFDKPLPPDDILEFPPTPPIHTPKQAQVVRRPLESTNVAGRKRYDPFGDEIQNVPFFKFDPVTALSEQSHLRKRYDPLVDQITKLIMKDGKLSVAQTIMSDILKYLATAPPPRLSPTAKLLLRGSTGPDLPLNPPHYLSVAIDSVAPLFRIRNQKGLAGGGAALPIPVPLRIRQRRRQAIVWILDVISKKRDSVAPFSQRFAQECIAIIEGRSGLWERKQAINALGIRARINVKVPRRR